MEVQKKNSAPVKVRQIITTKNLFYVSLLVIVLTITSIWFFGLGQHRTLFVNSLLSTTILSTAFFLFIAIGLFKGIKLKDDIGKLTDQIKFNNLPDVSGGLEFPSDGLDIGEGIGGIIVGIIVWIIFSILLLLFIWVFSTVVWAMILVFAAMLYWIFFRALRLVFKNSNECKNNLTKSIAYGIGYTVLYNFWIYGIILISHYLV